jgi:hypothetical protein
MTTQMAAAFIFAVFALYCWNSRRGLERFVYSGGLGLLAATLIWPDAPAKLMAFLSGATLSGAGQTLLTAALTIAVPVVGLLYILGLKKRR